MFNKKKTTPRDSVCIGGTYISEREVKCETCKHKIDRIDAQEVKKKYYTRTEWECLLQSMIERIYFCPMHRVKWDVINTIGKTKYYKTIPAHEVEVDENGKEIKKKKGD